MLGQSLSFRHHRVRKSMARIKFVLNERRLALIEAQRRAREDVPMSIDGDDEVFEERV